MMQPATLLLFLCTADSSCPLFTTTHGCPLALTKQLPGLSSKSPPHQL